MAFKIKLLNSGQTVTSGNNNLYTVTSPAIGAIVDNIRLVNATGVNSTVDLFVVPNGASQLRILTQNYSALNSVGVLVVKPELTLGVGDSIVATTSAAMDFVVSGVEQM